MSEEQKNQKDIQPEDKKKEKELTDEEMGQVSGGFDQLWGQTHKKPH